MEVEYLKYSSGVAVREYVEQMVKMSTGMAKAAYEYILRNGEYFEGASPSQPYPEPHWLEFS